MKKVILDQAVLTEILRVNKEADSFCVVLSCSLVKLHENAELYTCLRSSREGIPCNLYIANHSETIAKYRGEMMEKEWLEAIGDGESVSVSFYHRSIAGNVEKTLVSLGAQMPMIPKTLCRSMERLSSEKNEVIILCHKKTYHEVEKEAFNKRSVIDLATIDSAGIDIIYFDGADKLIEKLLYGGCRELTVFITDVEKAKHMTKRLDKLSRKAPFSNRLTVVIGNKYEPKTKTTLLIGDANAMTLKAPACIFFAVNASNAEGLSVFVGQNTKDLIPGSANHHLKAYTLHYITSIMSELVLRAVSTKEYHAKRLFRVNAKTLMSETIIKEE